MPMDQVTDAVRDEYNVIWVGAHDGEVDTDIPFEWNDDEIDIGPISWDEAGILFVFPDGDRLNAVIDATEADRHALYRISPFSSRSGLPDYYIWGTTGAMRAGGFFNGDWEYVVGE